MNLKEISHWIPVLFLLFFGIFAFPEWYALTYTKLWEVKQMLFVSRDTQMLVLHPRNQMSSLIALKAEIATQSAHTAVVIVPQKRTFGLSHNPAFVRGYLQSALPQTEILIGDAMIQSIPQDASCFFLQDPNEAEPEFLSFPCLTRKASL